MQRIQAVGDSYSVLILIFVKEVWLAHRIVLNEKRFCIGSTVFLKIDPGPLALLRVTA